MENKKQPPDFSGWNLTPHKVNVFWDEKGENLVPSMDTRPQPGFIWWGTANFYKYPPNPDISGTELLAFGKQVIMKIWGFSGDDEKSLAAFINGSWHVVDEKHGEEVEIDSDVSKEQIIKTEVSVLRADKTVIGKTVITI